MIKNYFITAWRSLTKYKSISLLNILGLSVGMTAAVLIFLWVDNELTFDSYHPDADRIYRLTTHMTRSKWVWADAPLRLSQLMRTDLPAAASVSCFQPAFQLNVHLGDDIVEEKNGAYVDTAWFSLFHYDFIAGGPASFNRHPFSLILTESKARQYFGDKDPIGQTLRLDSVPYEIAGVVRDNPANSSFRFEIMAPIAALLSDSATKENDLQWGNFNYETFVKLHSGSGSAAAGHAISAILSRNNPSAEKDAITLTPLKDIHFESDLSSADVLPHADSTTVYIFSILGIFLLLIACINYVNLTTARAGIRAKEVGIRKIVGAGKTSLFGQFLFESLTVSMLALAVTLLLITLAMPLFRQLSATTIREPLSIPHTWKILGATLMASALLNGIYPALLLSSFRPLNVLKGSFLPVFKDVSLRKSLVVLQFTFSIILIVGTLVIRRQMDFIQHTNPGYSRSQIFTFRLPWTRNRKTEAQAKAGHDGLRQQLLAWPSITGVSLASQSVVNLGSSNSGSADWDGKDPKMTVTVFQLSADEDFRDLTDLQMRQGRWFSHQQPTDRHNFIVNETAIRQFNIPQPVIGRRFSFQGDTGVVIGVVKDFHFASMHTKIGPLVILNHPTWQSIVFVKTAPGRTADALAAARRIWSQNAPEKPFDYVFLDDTFDNLYKTDTRTARLILIFSSIAIVISCLGLLGLAAFTARRRLKEIGIRKVLGASIPNIITLLSRDFIRLVLLSVLIATPVAWWTMHSWLNNFAYHIPLSPWIFATAGLLAVAIALLTIATQSIRAAATNPVQHLRTE